MQIVKDCEAGRYFELPSGKIFLATWEDMNTDYQMKEFRKKWEENWPFLWTLIKIAMPESPFPFIDTPRLRKGELIEDVADVFYLTKMDLLIRTPLQDASATKILAAIEGAKSRPLAKVLTGFGIRHIGRTWCKTLVDQYKSIEALTNETWLDMIQVPGLGHVRASSLHSWFRTEGSHKIIEKMRVAGVTALETSQGSSNAVSSAVRGKTFMFTGRMEIHRRAQAQEIVEELGGIAGTSISSSTDFLVVGEKPGSKLFLAKMQGVPTITEVEFLDMVKEKDA